MTIQDIFNSLPQRFRSDKAGDYQTIFHFDFDNGTEKFTVNIAQGNCEVQAGWQGTPKCTVKTQTETYIGVETGKINPQTAIMAGQIQIDNLMEMMNFGRLFKKLEISQIIDNPSINLKESHSRKPSSGPLQGMKILDFTRLLPGPLATMMLADMGAEVIKIEAPKFYDYTRDFPPHLGGEVLDFQASTRG